MQIIPLNLDSVLLFLHNSKLAYWEDENIRLRLKSCTRKRPIWQEIGDLLMACGYEDREGEACKNRLNTLVTAYRQSKDELKETGNATSSKKPPFFDELDKILNNYSMSARWI